MARSRYLTPESIIRAVKAGDFYASSGVVLNEVAVADGELRLEIAAEKGVSYTTQFIGTPVDYDKTTQPRKDKAGAATTQKYSSDVGKVFATVKGSSARYKLTGKELYVRAVVTSDKPHRDPSFAKQTEQAWTQPIGWEGRLRR